MNDLILGCLRESVRYVDPSKMDHQDYFDHLIAYNRTFQRKVGRSLKQIPYSKQGTHIFMTVGSDARLEKGPVSGIEVVLLSSNEGVGQEIGHELRKYIGREEHKDLFDQELEIRYSADPGSQWTLNRGTSGEKKLISLNRVYDAVKLAGDASLIRNLKGGLAGELLGENGKKLIESVEAKSREHRKVSLTGQQTFKGDVLTHYELDAGVAHYDPTKRLMSFKQGPLRAIQFALVRDQSRAIRSGIDPEIFFEFPENTVEKLNALEVQGISNLKMGQTRELCDQYKYFMWLYHISQANHRKGIVTSGFDVKQTKERIESLNALLSENHLVRKKEELTLHGLSVT